MGGNKLAKAVDELIEELREREGEQDKMLPKTREIVRECSLAIRAIHSAEISKSKEHLKKADSLLAECRKTKNFEYLLEQPLQEICEAKTLLAIVERKELPTFKDLNMNFNVYLLGLCDLIGELRRHMLENLRKEKKEEAEYFFAKMNEIYDALLPIRFSNSLLPGFRKKQDVARMQVEQARSEITRSRH
ncbi:Translin family protein [Candidatus Gugararchaeum adminiculabundum]|nr:Translin family protein [Candidatus Gugararchaeum adminiculabundum]